MLLNLAPPMATVLRNGWEVKIPTAEVLAGDTVVVRPGNKIPVDGTVTRGDSFTLQYRDYPHLPKFVRHRSGIAMMSPAPAGANY